MSIETDVREGLARIATALPRFEIDPAPIVRAGRHRHTRLIATSIGAVGLAMVVLAASIVLPRHLGGAPPVSAAEALRQLATVSASQDGLVPGPGQFTFSHMIERSSGTHAATQDPHANYSFTLTYNEYQWVASDYSGRSVMNGATVEFPSPVDRAAWVAAGSPDLTPGEDYLCGRGGLQPGLRISEVPTDVAGVLASLRNYGGGDPNEGLQMFGALEELLNENNAAFNLYPQRRAAILAAVSQLNGVSFVSDATDVLGRSGYGFRWTLASGDTHTLIFDPLTGEFLGVDSASSTGDSGGYAVAQVGVTDSMTSTPDGKAMPWSGPLPDSSRASNEGLCVGVG
jgi:hypothetical protein